MTQWIGLGEHCHCKIKSKIAVQEKLGHTKHKRKIRCNRCKKPRGSRNQSMTQWLFQAEFCVCPIDSNEDIALFSGTPTPNRIPLPTESHASVLFDFENLPKTLTISLFGFLIALTLFGFTYLHFSTQQWFDSFGFYRVEPRETLVALASHSSELYSSPINLDASGFETFEKNGYDTLSIGNDRLKKGQLKSAVNLRGLKNLSLNGAKLLSMQDFQMLSEAKELQFLEIDDMSLNEDVCKILAAMPLQKLELNRCSVEPEALKPIIISKIPSLALMIPLSETTKRELSELRHKENNALYSLNP